MECPQLKQSKRRKGISAISQKIDVFLKYFLIFYDEIITIDKNVEMKDDIYIKPS